MMLKNVLVNKIFELISIFSLEKQCIFDDICDSYIFIICVKWIATLDKIIFLNLIHYLHYKSNVIFFNHTFGSLVKSALRKTTYFWWYPKNYTCLIICKKYIAKTCILEGFIWKIFIFEWISIILWLKHCIFEIFGGMLNLQKLHRKSNVFLIIFGNKLNFRMICKRYMRKSNAIFW